MYRGREGWCRDLLPALLLGIPNISDQIKVAENTQDLSGLVGGSAGVKRLRPQGQRPARSGPSKQLTQGHMCPLLFFPGILQVSGQGSAGFEVKEDQILLWQQVLLQNVTSHLPH